MVEQNSSDNGISIFQTFVKEYSLPIIFGIFSFILILVAGVMLVKSRRISSPIEFSSLKESTSSSRTRSIYIDIEGAVVKPGVYELPYGSRVEDAIYISGGLAKDADSEYISKNINRAGRLVDGSKLYIPQKGEAGVSVTYKDSNSGIGARAGIATVNINTASSSELESLSGVGPKTSEKIIQNRPYMTLEELVTKNVMYRSTFEKIKNELSL